MKISVFLLFLLFVLPFSLLAQKENLIGTYTRYSQSDGDDTAFYIYLSMDSVRVVRATLIQQGNNISIKTQSGIWSLTDHDALLQFNDGTTKRITFRRNYAITEGAPPIEYFQLNIDGVICNCWDDRHGNDKLINSQIKHAD